MREISLWIDVYDDIFSDFDPRPYSDRNLSDDFLNEMKKVIRENDYSIAEFSLLVPTKDRNIEIESIIIKRLHEHFRKAYHYLKDKILSERKKGVLKLGISLLMMLSASYVSSLHADSLILNILFVFLEPTGWYIGWLGLDGIFRSEKTGETELKFYSKMQRCKITFKALS